MKSGHKVTSLGAALRRKFRTPREAILALGLDADLISLKRLALDGALKRRAGDEAPNAEPDLMELREKLETLLGEHLSGEALHRARELVDLHCGAGDYDRAFDNAEEDDDDKEGEASEEDWREQRRRMMATIAEFMATRKGMSNEEIASELADFPLRGLARGEHDQDVEDLMRERGIASNKGRDRRLAHDAAAERNFYDRFPEAVRLRGTALDTVYGVQPVRVVMDGESARFFEFFPEAARITNAGGGH